MAIGVRGVIELSRSAFWVRKISYMVDRDVASTHHPMSMLLDYSLARSEYRYDC